VQKSEKELVVAELTERLRTSSTLIVADYRGLTNSEIDGLRSELLKQGARFTVVKNTLTRIAAEAAGADALLALLEGPTAIAFVEAEGDPVAVAKALGDSARTTRVLAIRGGVLEGRSMSAEEVEGLAKLPPFDVLRGQVLGAIIAPLTTIVALFNAPLQNLIGLIDARIEQLGGSAETDSPDAEPEAAAAVEEAPADEAPAEAEAAAPAAGPEAAAAVEEAAPAAEPEAAAAVEEAPAEAEAAAPPEAEPQPETVADTTSDSVSAESQDETEE
jgi:large subunit ribosomal protein L10